MEQLDSNLIINISEFLDYKETICFFSISKSFNDIYKNNIKYIQSSIFNKSNIWIIDNPLSFTIRSKTKGYTMHKSICKEPFQWFKKIHYKIIE